MSPENTGDMTQSLTATLLITCPDRKGLVAAVAGGYDDGSSWWNMTNLFALACCATSSA